MSTFLKAARVSLIFKHKEVQDPHTAPPHKLSPGRDIGMTETRSTWPNPSWLHSAPGPHIHAPSLLLPVSSSQDLHSTFWAPGTCKEDAWLKHMSLLCPCAPLNRLKGSTHTKWIITKERYLCGAPIFCAFGLCDKHGYLCYCLQCLHCNLVRSFWCFSNQKAIYSISV